MGISWHCWEPTTFSYIGPVTVQNVVLCHISCRNLQLCWTAASPEHKIIPHPCTRSQTIANALQNVQKRKHMGVDGTLGQMISDPEKLSFGETRGFSSRRRWSVVFISAVRSQESTVKHDGNHVVCAAAVCTPLRTQVMQSQVRDSVWQADWRGSCTPRHDWEKMELVATGGRVWWNRAGLTGKHTTGGKRLQMIHTQHAPCYLAEWVVGEAPTWSLTKLVQIINDTQHLCCQVGACSSFCSTGLIIAISCLFQQVN